MIDFGPRSTPSDPARLGAALARLGGVYRSMPESKLLGRLPDGRSRAVAGHALADELARAAQGIAERSRAQPPLWREVPFVGPFVVGDQLTVMGYELSAAVAGLGREDEEVWSAPHERAAADQVLTGLAHRVRELSLGC